MDLEASPVERKQLEYATQHFGFTADSLIDTIDIFALENLHGVIKGVKAHCSKTFADKVSKEDMNNAFALIQDRYTAVTEKVLEDFGRHVTKKILTIPPNVVLPEDRVHVTKHAAQDNFDGETMDKELETFDRMCQNSRGVRYKLAVLEAKLSNLKRVKEVQTSLAKEAKFLKDNNQVMEGVFTQQTLQLEKKLERLRSLMDNIRRSTDEMTEASADKKRKLAEVKAAEVVFAKRKRHDFLESESESGKENAGNVENKADLGDGPVDPDQAHE